MSASKRCSVRAREPQKCNFTFCAFVKIKPRLSARSSILCAMHPWACQHARLLAVAVGAALAIATDGGNRLLTVCEAAATLVSGCKYIDMDLMRPCAQPPHCTVCRFRAATGSSVLACTAAGVFRLGSAH